MGNTIVIQIGNTDNKLTQQGWSEFADLVSKRIELYSGIVHFSGGSSTIAPWQNYCWVFILRSPIMLDLLKDEIAGIGKQYNQDSIAMTIGDTVFI